MITECKIFFGIGCLIFVLCLVNVTYKSINFHNSRVEKEQQNKLKRANKINDGKSIEFEVFDISRGLTIYETVLFFQIFTVLPLLYALWNYNKKLSTFNTILGISWLNLLCYLFWIYGSYIGRKGNEVFDFATDTFQSYLMIEATFLEFLLFLCFLIFSIAQSFCLIRFIIEKFQYK